MRSLILTHTWAGMPAPGVRRGEIDLAEPTLADEPIEAVGAAGFGAVRSWCRRARSGPSIGTCYLFRAPSGQGFLGRHANLAREAS